MREAFVGAWRLESWVARLGGGRTGHPFGERARGTLVYTADGTMCAAFENPARPPLGMTMEALAACRRYWLGLRADAPPGADAARERFLAAALGFNAYAARWTVSGEHIHHDVEVALYPEWVGTRLTRRFRFEGERLLLEIEGERNDVLAWRRR